MLSQTQSQSQYGLIQNGHRLPVTEEDLKTQVKDYLSRLIVGNNERDGDQGVLKVLELLDKENPIKVIKSA